MLDEIVQHVYLIEEGLVRSMEIRKPQTYPRKETVVWLRVPEPGIMR
jgi:hypothetical protein